MNAPMQSPESAAQDDRLSAALDPQSVAVVGASENPEKIGGRPIKYMLRAGYTGRIDPVNPNRAQIQGNRPTGGRRAATPSSCHTIEPPGH